GRACVGNAGAAASGAPATACERSAAAAVDRTSERAKSSARFASAALVRFRSGGALQNAMSLANHFLNMLKMRSDRRIIGHHLQIICSRFYDAERLSQVVNQI